MPDISELEWASEAFGAPPEATNLWIGGDESVTSFHKARLGIHTLLHSLLWCTLGALSLVLYDAH